MTRLLRSAVSRTIALVIMVLMTLTMLPPQHASAELPGEKLRPLSIDDVLDREALDRIAPSPDGEWVAAVVIRPARTGEVYGRASHEVDPTRSDIWLISARTGERRRLTDGHTRGAGFWCATWSPDGERLAMLSTAPEGNEPHGGDNVRLYVWERATGAVTRMGAWPVMTQTRYGSALDKLDMRGGANGGGARHRCTVGPVAENAPFLWLDARRLLVATLRDGEVSAALDNYTRPYRVAAADAARLREGVMPTSSAVASGAARSPADLDEDRVTLRVVDAATRRAFDVATVPAYPFRGWLTASVSPDGRRLAVMATGAAISPQAGHALPNARSDGWTVTRRLGFAGLDRGGKVRWTAPLTAARYPLELYGWSPDGRSVALRARAETGSGDTPLFVAHAGTGVIVPFGSRPIGTDAASVDQPHPPAAVWIDDRRLAARASDGAWLLMEAGRERPISWPDGASPPDRLYRAGDGGVRAVVGRVLLRLDPARATMTRLAEPGRDLTLLAPDDDAVGALRKRLVALRGPDDAWSFATMDMATGALGPAIPAPSSRPLTIEATPGAVFHVQDDGRGARVMRTTPGGAEMALLTLNPHLAAVDWGERRLILYRSTAGADLNAAVILPPGYRPGERYPTLVWVYGGYMVPRDLGVDLMTALSQPGFYNLALYAAQGYVVLVPSMPLGPRDGETDVLPELSSGVLPALDRLIELGITDAARVGVFGQSFGGYSVMGLLAQTDRFRAGVAIAGISELASNYLQIDPTARGYSGIEHEKSDNPTITPLFGLHVPPWSDPAGYARNSPLSHVDRVDASLLLLHGEFDIRGAPTQAELFFNALYAQEKTAELVRYGGESHSLAQSPANVRDVFRRTVAWFDRFLLPDPTRRNDAGH